MNTKPKRLLCIVGGMNAGGAETFLMKVYRALDKSEFQMDFYVTSHEEGFYDKEIKSLGGQIYLSTPKSKGFFKSFKALKEVVKKEEYKNVLRVSQHSLSSLDLLAAKFGGAENLIYRSSNSDTGGGRVNKFLHKIFKGLSMTIPTLKVAPSTEAAEFMFGKGCVTKNETIIIKNAIPLENFVFDQNKKIQVQKELNIQEKFVVGHVGRFNKQKNHDFLIDIFSEIVKKQSNSVLILVGKGELENEIREKIDRLNLTDKVIFTGVRTDIAELMMSMDVFVFPSHFEGMPNTVIEAQATGLPCIISNNISKEVQITNLIEYLSLNDSAEKWAEVILHKDYESVNRISEQNFINMDYDIKSTASLIEQTFFADKK